MPSFLVTRSICKKVTKAATMKVVRIKAAARRMFHSRDRSRSPCQISVNRVAVVATVLGSVDFVLSRILTWVLQ